MYKDRFILRIHFYKKKILKILDIGTIRDIFQYIYLGIHRYFKTE